MLNIAICDNSELDALKAKKSYQKHFEQSE